MSGGMRPLFTWRSAICCSDLPPMVRHVALTLALHMNERGGSARPSATTLAVETGLHVRTVREGLKRLEDDGWLVCTERGGLRGSKRRANEYEARQPLATHDRWSETTGAPESATGGPEYPPPVVLDHPISSRNSSRNSPRGRAAPDDPESDPIKVLVAGYIADYRASHNDHSPSKGWIAAAARAAGQLRDEGEPIAVLALCLGMCAQENKNPGVLPAIVADYHRDVA